VAAAPHWGSSAAAGSAGVVGVGGTNTFIGGFGFGLGGAGAPSAPPLSAALNVST